MDIKEAETNIGCLVQVSRTDYSFGGMVYLLAAAWREVSMSGSKDYGVILKDTVAKGTVEMKADKIDLIPYNYPQLKYTPERGTPLTVYEIMKLMGSVVSVDNEPVWLKRIYKKADEYRRFWYEADIKEITEPYTERRVQLREITRYTGEPPELPVMQKEKIAPLRKRQLEKEMAAAGINDTVRRCQTETLEHLKALAAKR